jgi:transcriptional regulator CtsR
MTELPTIDLNLMVAIKNLMENIKNDVDQYASADKIVDLVDENKLNEKEAYRSILQSLCALLRDKGFNQTADLLTKHWRLPMNQ